MPYIDSVPRRDRAIGYTRAPDGLPLTVFDRDVPQPAPGALLVHVVSSSLNPLDYKLAELNFLGRTPPVALGFDFAGVVVDRGAGANKFELGEAVFGMAPSNGDGVWAAGGAGGYVSVPEYMVVRKPDALSFIEAGVLGVCYLSAYLALADRVEQGATIYIPGGGGGVGHLAIQKAKAMGAGTIFSSAGNPASRALALDAGADKVFDYRRDDIASEIDASTAGRGVDLVFDATYSEDSFVATAKMVRAGGRWIVLGVGPGKTTRLAETASPVAGILTGKSAQQINVNLLRLFAEPGALDAAAKAALARGLDDAARGGIRPHISATIASEVDAINTALADMKAGRGSLGKIAVVVDQRLV